MDAIPLAPRVDLAQYRKLAKELLAAWRSADEADGGEDAARRWATAWLERLANHGPAVPVDLAREVDRIEAQLRAPARPTLARAQHVLARLHAFESWPRFAAHLAGLQRATTEAARFEAAADAIVSGDLPGLQALLRAEPTLVRARSDRRHHATLLHYVAANGVEDFRQRTPGNVVDVARALLAAGAEVDAPNDDYGGRGTALGLVATSAHPRRAGVQLALMEVLVAAGADLDGLPGGWTPLRAALANGCPEAAVWLAERGARTDLVGAAGVGLVDRVERLLAEAEVPQAQLDEALIVACCHGRDRVVELLLDHGADLGASDGQTGLHLAVHEGRLGTVQLLLARGASLEAVNAYGGTALAQALWSAVHVPERDYRPIVAALLAAGAEVDPGWSTGIAPVDALLRRRLTDSRA